mgnify:CR=1 FL=1
MLIIGRQRQPRRRAPSSVELSGTGFRFFFDRIVQYGLEYFQLYYGTYKARVVSNEDPVNEGQPDPFGRLVVRIPAVGDGEDVRRIAWPIAPVAGSSFGFKSLPPAGSNVYVVFERGQVDAPLWMGGWWPRDAIPTEFNKTETHYWITPGGHQVILDEQDGGQVVRIRHMDEETRLEFDNDGNVFIVNRANAKIHIGDGADTLTPTQPGVLGEKLKGLMEELIDAIKAMTVPTPAGPSGTAINFAQFDAVKGRLQEMLSETVDLK